jgi:hypothetical protein
MMADGEMEKLAKKSNLTYCLPRGYKNESKRT